MTTRILPPEADGLYDPRFEHDACGVAMVAKLDNVAVPRGRACAPWRRWTTSSTAAPRAPTSRRATAPGSSRSSRDAFFRTVVDFELPPRRPLRRRRSASCRRTPTCAARSSSSSSSTSASRASTCWAGATCRSTRSTWGTTAEPLARPTSASSSSRPARAPRRPDGLRAQALRHPPHRRARHRAPTSTRLVLEPHASSTRGC